MKKLTSDSESCHENLVRILYSPDPQYFRFNVGEGLSGVKLDKWKKGDSESTERRIEKETMEYLKDIESNLLAVATKLVKNRRARCQAPLKSPEWIWFCTDNQNCGIQGCCNGPFPSKTDFIAHFNQVHG